jgi:hypothetical protein
LAVDDVNYASKLHPDVQRGAVGTIEEVKPVFDVTALGMAPPFVAGALGADDTIAEEDEEGSNSEGESAEGSKQPFVVNGSGDPTTNRYPHPSLGQLAGSGLQGSSEVLTASLIEIRKHPST